MNNIPKDQLHVLELDKLASQRELYSIAKRLLGIQTILSVPCVAILSALAAWQPDFRLLATSWGIGVTLIDLLIFGPYQKHLKLTASTIQEAFDCDVLQLPWNTIKAQRQPSRETIIEYASKYKKREPSLASLQNWYPTSVGDLPLPLGRLVCQRINCWWDAKLRERYVFWLVVVLVALSCFVAIFGLASGLTVDRFFLGVLAPLMPALLLGIRQFMEHKDAISTLNRLKEHSETLWNQALKIGLSEDESTRRSRDLQDEIFDHRRRNPLIFDWIYKRLRRPDEEYMIKTAQQLVMEAHDALKT